MRQVRSATGDLPPAASDGAGEEHDTCIPVACSRRVRAKWSLGRELARRVAGGRLPSWECAEVVAAEVSSAVPLDPRGQSDLDEELRPGASLADVIGQRRPTPDGLDSDANAPGEADGAGEAHQRTSAMTPAGACHDAPPRVPEFASLLAGLEEADAFALDRRLRRVLQLERTHEARIGPLLRRVLDRRLYRRRGYWDRDRYLEEHLGLCARKARALVRIERVLERAPQLARAYRSGQLSWVQMQTLAPVFETGVAETHAAGWIGRAARVTVRWLEDDVRAALALADLDAASFARTSGVSEDPQEVIVKQRKIGAGPSVGAGRATRKTRAPSGTTEDVAVAFHAPAESARFFRAVLEEVREGLTRARGAPVSEGEAFEAMLDHALQAWSERDGRAQREHRILERDGWRCAVPGCTSHRNLQVHHVVFRSRGGGDEPENLITLCAWHHQRGIHGGLLRITGRAPDRLRFELGLRDGAPPLLVYESGDRLVE